MTAASFTQIAGTTTLNNSTLKSDGTLSFTGGQLQGQGTIDGNVHNSGARFIPTPTGWAYHILTIDGDYTQTSGGTLALMLTGMAKDSKCDQLVVDDDASIAGMLDLRISNLSSSRSVVGPSSGWDPTVDVYRIVKADAVTGFFQSMRSTTLPGTTLTVKYEKTAVAIVPSSAIVVPPPPVEPAPPPPAPPKKDPTVVNNTGLGQSTTSGSGFFPSTTLSVGQGIGGRLDDLDDNGVLDGDLGRFVATILSFTNVNHIGDGLTSSGDSSGSNTSAKFGTATMSHLGGEKHPSNRATHSVVAEEALASFQLSLPPLDLPSEDDLLASVAINQALLVGGRARADILPQTGSQLSVVATLVSGEESGTGDVVAQEERFADLLINPLRLHAPVVVAAKQSDVPPIDKLAMVLTEEALKRASEQEAEREQRPRPNLFPVMSALGIMATLLVGVCNTNGSQRKACSLLGKLPSRTSRQNSLPASRMF
jgi:hypothetical protein